MAKVILDTETGETIDITSVQPPMQDPMQYFGVMQAQLYNKLMQQAFNEWLNCMIAMFK